MTRFLLDQYAIIERTCSRGAGRFVPHSLISQAQEMTTEAITILPVTPAGRVLLGLSELLPEAWTDAVREALGGRDGL